MIVIVNEHFIIWMTIQHNLLTWMHTLYKILKMSLNFNFIKLNEQAVKLNKLNFRIVHLNANMVNVNKKSWL